MPVLRSIRARFAAEQPLAGAEGRRVPARHRRDGEPRPRAARGRGGGALCAANPYTAQADVAEALGEGVHVGDYREGLEAVAATRPDLVLDDGAELIAMTHGAPARRDGGDAERPRPRSLARSRLPGARRQRGRGRARAERPLRHRPVGARRDRPRDARAARRADDRRARLRLDGARHRAARPRRRRVGGRLRGRSRCARSRRGWRASTCSPRWPPPSAATSSSPSPAPRRAARASTSTA